MHGDMGHFIAHGDSYERHMGADTVQREAAWEADARPQGCSDSGARLIAHSSEYRPHTMGKTLAICRLCQDMLPPTTSTLLPFRPLTLSAAHLRTLKLFLLKPLPMHAHRSFPYFSKSTTPKSRKLTRVDHDARLPG